MANGRALATATDPDGFIVELTAERWQHILDGHPELGPFRHLVLRAVANPDRRIAGRFADESWFYLTTDRPSRWLKVVVRYAGDRGTIATAFPRRSFP
jgi:hypothetical protein